MTVCRTVVALVLLAVPAPAWAAGKYFEVTYPPSTTAGELQIGVTYTLWIPDGAKRLRGVIVHQHGCGTGACQGGATAAYDLHWQALARKWDCALLGPSYQQQDGQDCSLWCDPRKGSQQAYLKALDEFAAKAERPELKTVPWCLWGHSGGGQWSGLMHLLMPERVVAVWNRSGSGFWDREKTKPELTEAIRQVPVVCNPGFKEKDDARFKGAWTGAETMFRAYRAAGMPVCLAPDPRTNHECGDARYLAIPFFDACLAGRLPTGEGQTLRPLDAAQAWLAPAGEFVGLETKLQASPAAKYEGDAATAVWLPNERVALAWQAYVSTGAVPDETPPAEPTACRAVRREDGSVEVTWEAEADFESGLAAFLIERDGQPLAQTPEKPKGRFGRALFQAMSYHDTPEKPLPELKYVDTSAPANAPHEYRVTAVNSVGLKSKASAAAKLDK